MITYVEDFFSIPVKVLVNPVNTSGVMGKGLAKVFKEKYPDMFNQYKVYCDNGSFTVGKLWVYKTPGQWVLNFPTKIHWRDKSELEYIDAGLSKFAESYSRKGLFRVAFPMLGCGNGGLKWEDVRQLMEHHLQPLPIWVFVNIREYKKRAKNVQGNSWRLH